MTLARRTLLQALGAAALPLGATAFAQGAPLERAVVYAGFAPGGTTDVAARRIAERLRPGYAASTAVENRTGAGGQIALSALKQAPADGSTIALTPMSMLGIYPHTYKKLPYDSVADFQPVSQAVRFDFAFGVGSLVPATVRTLPEFVAWCKANPSMANFGSPAAGSVPHFVGELFGRAAGLDLKHVPYRGSQPAIVDVMGGQVAAASAPLGEFLQHLPTGRVRLIASSGPTRSRFAPTVPTFAEQGFRDIVFDEWYALYLPARTPAATVERLSQAIRAILAMPEVVEGLAQMGLESKGSTPAELAALLKRDTERWAPLVKTIGFTAES